MTMNDYSFNSDSYCCDLPLGDSKLTLNLLINRREGRQRLDLVFAPRKCLFMSQQRGDKNVTRRLNAFPLNVFLLWLKTRFIMIYAWRCTDFENNSPGLILCGFRNAIDTDWEREREKKWIFEKFCNMIASTTAVNYHRYSEILQETTRQICYLADFHTTKAFGS